MFVYIPSRDNTTTSPHSLSLGITFCLFSVFTFLLEITLRYQTVFAITYFLFCVVYISSRNNKHISPYLPSLLFTLRVYVSSRDKTPRYQKVLAITSQANYLISAFPRRPYDHFMFPLCLVTFSPEVKHRDTHQSSQFLSIQPHHLFPLFAARFRRIIIHCFSIPHTLSRKTINHHAWQAMVG